MQEFENKHLDIRGQFFMRIGGRVLRNPDTAYKFIGVVCGAMSINELVTLEALFTNSLKDITNAGKN